MIEDKIKMKNFPDRISHWVKTHKTEFNRACTLLIGVYFFPIIFFKFLNVILIYIAV